MRIIHLTNAHWGSGHATGVPRFSRYFQQAFPEAIQATPSTLHRVHPTRDDVVVTDNHLSMMVPRNVLVLITHHGCAQTHLDRDPSWRGAGSHSLCAQQREMFSRPFNRYVAPSQWVADAFRRYVVPVGCSYKPVIIPNWVPAIDRPRRQTPERPVVIGDWSNTNKGGDVIPAIKAALPQFRFERLDFPAGDDAAREAFYRDADVYLCLSMSEGGPYSVADAEAAGLPIVTTEVGNVYEFRNIRIISRDDPIGIGDALDDAINTTPAPGFYETWTFDKWRDAWSQIMERETCQGP